MGKLQPWSQTQTCHSVFRSFTETQISTNCNEVSRYNGQREWSNPNRDIWPIKPKIFIIWPLAEKVCQPSLLTNYQGFSFIHSNTLVPNVEKIQTYIKHSMPPEDLSNTGQNKQYNMGLGYM